MKIRYSKAEGTLRSIGDPPNGIVIVTWSPEDGPGFAIDDHFEPSSGRGTEITRPVHPSPHAVIADITELVAGAEGEVELGYIRDSAVFTFQTAVRQFLPALNLEAIEVYLEFLRETRNAIRDRIADA